IQAGADAEDWRRLLLLLSSSADELLADGGIAKAWAATGRSHFEIEEIDYAEVLKERDGGEAASWDRVLAFCLKGEAVTLDDSVITMLLGALESSGQFGGLLERLHDKAESDGSSLPTRVAALMQLLKAALAAVEARQSSSRAQVLGTVAEASAHLTPDMILGLASERESPNPENAQIAREVLGRMPDASIASFVARTVVSEQGASARLAQAFEALVPDEARRGSVLDLAHDEAKAADFGQDPRFDMLWLGARTMLTTYSDEGFVSSDYARELTAARTQAVEVERLSDDPPERIAAWLSSVNERAISELDLDLTLDLLRLESEPSAWEPLAALAGADIERRALSGDFAGAQRLVDGLAAADSDDRAPLRASAARIRAQLAGGPFARHVALQLRKATEADVAAISHLCQSLGPAIVRPLAETLATEDHVHTIRRLRELLLSFGMAGRQAVEPLKNAQNPAVRRTAIDLLRVFGGNEALQELTAMLGDADPQVQQDSIRAIVQIGTPEAYAALERACGSNDGTRDTVVRELVSLRDPKTIPPLCYVLTTTEPKGAVVGLHEAIIEALAGLRANSTSTAALRTALYRGTWWAPVRTARLRQAAASGLRRLGSEEDRAVLAEALNAGSRGVRKVAASELEAMSSPGGRP
ncbi:MAG TPA: HEAT repeat domain-containing protein, partial [Vicinamibacterales bacterium]